MPEIAAPFAVLPSAPSVRVGVRLSEQLSDALVASIRDGALKAGQRLPTEAALVDRFGVSRTVVREALSRLRTLGLLESRQGSGAWVREPEPADDRLLLASDGSAAAVLQIIEVRRALEAEAAALAAARRTAKSVRRIGAALTAIDSAVADGGDGVAEDVAFHAAIAEASGNPYLLATLGYLSRFLIDATRVTRANEATRHDLAEDVRCEHALLLRRIEDGDIVAARFAGAAHMVNAAGRIARADPVFWRSRGRALANRLRVELGTFDEPLRATPTR